MSNGVNNFWNSHLNYFSLLFAIYFLNFQSLKIMQQPIDSGSIVLFEMQLNKCSSHIAMWQILLKVSKSQKQILKFSFEPKTKENIFVFLPQPQKRGQIKKIMALYTNNQRIFILILLHYFFNLAPFYRLGQKDKYFRLFFGANENFKKSFRK